VELVELVDMVEDRDIVEEGGSIGVEVDSMVVGIE
jgi:hypothetical protein